MSLGPIPSVICGYLSQGCDDAGQSVASMLSKNEIDGYVQLWSNKGTGSTNYVDGNKDALAGLGKEISGAYGVGFIEDKKVNGERFPGIVSSSYASLAYIADKGYRSFAQRLLEKMEDASNSMLSVAVDVHNHIRESGECFSMIGVRKGEAIVSGNMEESIIIGRSGERYFMSSETGSLRGNPVDQIHHTAADNRVILVDGEGMRSFNIESVARI